MKSAIIKSICILLVELPEGDILFENHYLEVINKDSLQTAIIVFNKDSINSYPIVLDENLSLENKYKYIAPLSEMTEEMFAEFVLRDSNEYYDGYNDYTKNVSALHSARESFLSAVEASDYYFQNPVPEPDLSVPCDSWIDDYNEALSRTFDSALTHIFKIEK